ncbi:hypothetical protein Tco_0917046 [Tanacetum coccineum]
MSNNILHVYPTAAASSSIHDLQYQLYLKIKDDEQARNAELSIWWPLKIKFEKPTPLLHLVELLMFALDNMKTIMMMMLLLRGRAVRKYKGCLNMEHIQWANRHLNKNNDEVHSKEVSPELLEEISRKIDEAQL